MTLPNRRTSWFTGGASGSRVYVFKGLVMRFWSLKRGFHLSVLYGERYTESRLTLHAQSGVQGRWPQRYRRLVNADGSGTVIGSVHLVCAGEGLPGGRASSGVLAKCLAICPYTTHPISLHHAPIRWPRVFGSAGEVPAAEGTDLVFEETAQAGEQGRWTGRMSR